VADLWLETQFVLRLRLGFWLRMTTLTVSIMSGIQMAEVSLMYDHSIALYFNSAPFTNFVNLVGHVSLERINRKYYYQSNLKKLKFFTRPGSYYRASRKFGFGK
jgi:hypothetical protein